MLWDGCTSRLRGRGLETYFVLFVLLFFVIIIWMLFKFFCFFISRIVIFGVVILNSQADLLVSSVCVV